MIHRLLPGVLALSLVASPSILRAQAAAAPAPTNAAPEAPAAAPAPPAPEATATTPAERPDSYTVESGDSLWTIAHKYGTTVVKLRKLNGLKKGALLHPGQVLKLPPATADSSAK